LFAYSDFRTPNGRFRLELLPHFGTGGGFTLFFGYFSPDVFARQLPSYIMFTPFGATRPLKSFSLFSSFSTSGRFSRFLVFI